MEVRKNKVIHVEAIRKKYGKKEVLKDISFAVHKGEIFGLIGPNGAGKTTLLSILATNELPNQGKITMNGYDVMRDRKMIRDMIGFVPQDIALWQQMTVEENFLFWNRLNKKRINKTELYQLCKKVQLTDQWKTKVRHLSGGMKRKLNIAVALIHNPQVLLMDEPTVGIDIQSKIEITRFIKEMAEQGMTVIYTTHDSNEILSLCDRIGVLKKGEFSFIGTIQEAENQLEFEGKRLKNKEEVLYTLLN